MLATHTHSWRGSWRYYLLRGARRCRSCPTVQIAGGRGRHVIGYDAGPR